MAFSAAGVVLLIFFGGCKKELTSDSENTKNNVESISSTKGFTGNKELLLSQSTGLKFTVNTPMIERLSPSIKNIDVMTAAWKNEQNIKKITKKGATVSNVNFTATLAGSYYNCYGEMANPGPYDWYLLNWNTGIYTYIGSTADNFINFNVTKPSMYGSYRLWADQGGFTGFQYLGDPYLGVSMVGGMLEFTDETAFNNLLNRLEQAYEDHQSNFVDSYNHLTDDQINNLAQAQGFDEFLPLKEFENYFGLQSYRQLIENQENQWLQNNILDLNTDPDGNSPIVEDVLRTLVNQNGDFQVASNSNSRTVSNTINLLNPPFGQPFQYCFLFGRNANYYPPWDNGNKTFKYVVALRNFPWQIGGAVVSKTINLRKKSSGGWEKYFTATESRISGTVFNEDCLYKGSFTSGNQSPKRYKSRIAKQKYWAQVITSKPTNISSFHYSNGRQINQVLQF